MVVQLEEKREKFYPIFKMILVGLCSALVLISGWIYLYRHDIVLLFSSWGYLSVNIFLAGFVHGKNKRLKYFCQCLPFGIASVILYSRGQVPGVIYLFAFMIFLIFYGFFEKARVIKIIGMVLLFVGLNIISGIVNKYDSVEIAGGIISVGSVFAMVGFLPLYLFEGVTRGKDDDK